MTPEFDTYAWQQLRNKKLMEWIGDPNAVEFIIQFASVCEVWDDLIDKDKNVPDHAINGAFWKLLLEVPLNPFFDKYKQNLIPILVTGVNAWIDSTIMEKSHDKNDKVFAYVLRDWYMEFVSFIIYLCRGREYLREVSMDVRMFFTHHETLDQYLEKLS